MSRIARRVAVARRLGARVRTLTPVVVDGRLVPRFLCKCRTNDDAISLYDAWAHDDADNDPGIKTVAAALKAQASAHAEGAQDIELAKLVQSYVQTHMRFQVEEIETNYQTLVALEMGEGDCDDHASVVVALAVAAGLDAHVHGVRDASGEITHAAPTITIDGVPRWAETTIAAEFGEHPYAAAVRLGILKSRPDIAG